MSRARFPHPLVLLSCGILLAAALTWVLPAGRFERRADPVTKRDVVVGGTFHRVAAQPVSFFGAVVSIPKGLADAGSVVFFVFLVGGAFSVVDRTGALVRGVDRLVRRLRRREALVIPISCICFAAAGMLENMQEEIIALVPVLLLLTRRLGFEALVAVAMSLGAAAVGAAFSPMNPFQVGIAQKLAQLPLLSGGLYRSVFLVAAVAIWIWWTLRFARRTRVERVSSEPEWDEGADSPAADVPLGWRGDAVLGLVVATFVVFIYGVLRLGWDFDQMTALFFLMGVLAGFLGKLGVDGTAEAFVNGFREMAFAALLIGFARAIYVVLDEGAVVDTIVNGLFQPLAHLPLTISALGMVVVQTLIHVPVPSVSGQAVLTIPILVPLSDLLHLSRQVTVLAYQYGAGMCELITPTNGALMAIIAAAGVRYEGWLRFVAPVYLLLVALGVVAVATGIAVGLA